MWTGLRRRSRGFTLIELLTVIVVGTAVQQSGFAGSRSQHPGGINTLFGDGSVRFCRSSVNSDLWIGANSIAGKEPSGVDSF